MDEQNQQPTQPPEEQKVGRVIRIKPFTFIMFTFLTILLTAGLTLFALTFGEEKIVEVKVPVEREEFSKLYDAYDELNEKYYKDLDPEKTVQGAIDGLFTSLEDPYSDYMDATESEQFNADLSSSFEGIGAEIQAANGYIKVVSPIKNSPAERAGMLPEDLILEVDGQSLQGYTASEAVLLIRGEKGTTVTLKVQREGVDAPIDVTIERAEIPVETVYGELLDGGVAHLQITSFSDETYNELVTYLEQYEKEGMTSIVLDVRQNPGGYLHIASNIANLFVPAGENILQTEEKNKPAEALKATSGKKYDVPVAVLIDNGSASASEILAAALLETINAPVVGKTSFGKGTMQAAESMDDGSTLKFTTGKWLTPKGNWVNETGITPTVEVDYPEYASLPYISPEIELKEGMISEEVKTVEQMLQALGYEVGELDGAFDNTLEAAVKEFQQQAQLEPTGVLTGDATTALMTALRDQLDEDDRQLKAAIDVLNGTYEAPPAEQAEAEAATENE
ncbi:S41 family peptidase [Caryophanon latum]|uniref:Peptidase S41 n=1 Tax=Caryophanon latum TaxID=33977 RepID=A0A1C0YUG7_9BACL|nr:S41 family peptidase [Caryophanon latum]OCS90826.1 peptidase S41 [Caryophanon latum]